MGVATFSFHLSSTLFIKTKYLKIWEKLTNIKQASNGEISLEGKGELYKETPQDGTDYENTCAYVMVYNFLDLLLHRDEAKRSTVGFYKLTSEMQKLSHGRTELTCGRKAT